MKKNIVAILFLFNLIIGCTSDETIVPLTGNIVGFVKLLDKNGHEMVDKSDIKVTASGNIVQYTDAAGKFEFEELKAGTYIFVFEKDGFGQTKRFNVKLTGGNRPSVLSGIFLIQHPSVQIQGLDIETQNTLQIY